MSTDTATTVDMWGSLTIYLRRYSYFFFFVIRARG